MIDTSFAGEIIDYLMALDGETEKFINLFLAAKCISDVRNRNVLALIDTKLLNQLKGLTEQRELDDMLLTRMSAVSIIAMVWKDDLKSCLGLKL